MINDLFQGETGVIITLTNFKWYEELVQNHTERWGVTLKKDRMKRPEDYEGLFDFLQLKFDFKVELLVTRTLGNHQT